MVQSRRASCFRSRAPSDTLAADLLSGCLIRSVWGDIYWSAAPATSAGAGLMTQAAPCAGRLKRSFFAQFWRRKGGPASAPQAKLTDIQLVDFSPPVSTRAVSFALPCRCAWRARCQR